MKFKYQSRWGLSADECAYIYTLCRLYRIQGIEVIARIGALVTEIGGEEYRRALWDCLTGGDSQLFVAQKYYLDQSTLSRLVRGVCAEVFTAQVKISRSLGCGMFRIWVGGYSPAFLFSSLSEKCEVDAR